MPRGPRPPRRTSRRRPISLKDHLGSRPSLVRRHWIEARLGRRRSGHRCVTNRSRVSRRPRKSPFADLRTRRCRRPPRPDHAERRRWSRRPPTPRPASWKVRCNRPRDTTSNGSPFRRRRRPDARRTCFRAPASNRCVHRNPLGRLRPQDAEISPDGRSACRRSSSLPDPRPPSCLLRLRARPPRPARWRRRPWSHPRCPMRPSLPSRPTASSSRRPGPALPPPRRAFRPSRWPLRHGSPSRPSGTSPLVSPRPAPS